MKDLIEGVTPILKAYSLKLTRNLMDAEDLYQETVYRIIKNGDKYEPGTNFNSWAAVVMRNLFINTYRKKMRRETILPAVHGLGLNMVSNSVDNEGEQGLYYQQIVDMINELPDALSAPFRMTLEGYRYKEISEKLGDVPIGTIKSRVHFARKMLRKMYCNRNPVEC